MEKGQQNKGQDHRRTMMEKVNIDFIPENDYLLLTPGPLSTTKTVRAAMLKDWCTWDDDYNNLVEDIRRRLVALATKNSELYTSILMQGSGTFSVEATIGSVVPKDGKLLILSNGAYGRRMFKIAEYLDIDFVACDFNDNEEINLNSVENILKKEPDIRHVAVVHCETTTGILNPIDKISDIVKKYNKIYIVDAMSSFGGLSIDTNELNIDFLISSSNKCIQGVPGFGFIIAKKEELLKCKGNARSLSLDIYDQWDTMETSNGKWRFTSPTHVVRAFYQALLELEEEGGIAKRFERYSKSQKTLVTKMEEIGISALIDLKNQSPIITSFICPDSQDFNFNKLYNILKSKKFVIYPGKLTDIDTFRIGTIGDVNYLDMIRLVETIEENKFW